MYKQNSMEGLMSQIGAMISGALSRRWSFVRTAGLLVAVLATGAGCSTQPTSPSPASVHEGTNASIPASSSSPAVDPARFEGRGTPGVILVTSQGLYYDTFVVADPLPMNGKFQLLKNGQTEFGPGQPGYLGGRWWEDTDNDGEQNAGDHFFLCPLLPPGRTTP
jgi:hypothetical protein